MTKKQEANVERFKRTYADEIEVYELDTWIVITKPYVSKSALKILGNCDYLIEGRKDGKLEISIRK